MEISSASQIQMDYMQLLVEQLKNQNPLDPMDSEGMAAQLAQFSQLQQAEIANEKLSSMNTNFNSILQATNRNYANSLLDRMVTFIAEDEISGELKQQKGKVTSSFNDPDSNEPLLGVTVGQGSEAQDYTLSLDAVILVEN